MVNRRSINPKEKECFIKIKLETETMVNHTSLMRHLESQGEISCKTGQLYAGLYYTNPVVWLT
jgi:hypothetical protein